jgi:uncharacterized protein
MDGKCARFSEVESNPSLLIRHIGGPTRRIPALRITEGDKGASMSGKASIPALLGVTAIVLGMGTGNAYGVVSYAAGTYSQNFDSLSNTGTTNAWTNDSTLTGWYALQSIGTSITTTGARDTGGAYAAVTNYRANDGTSNTGALYSHGTTAATDRALGSVGSGTPGDFVWALVLQNTSGGPLTSFTLSYTGEQWRKGGATTPAVDAAQTLDFDYATFAAAPALTDLYGDNVAPYTNPGGVGGTLDFTSPQFGTSTPTALDGNLAANRTALTGSPSLTWNAGEYLVLRFWDDNHPGNDHGLAIDDLSFSATPEPATIGLLLLGATLLRRRRTA